MQTPKLFRGNNYLMEYKRAKSKGRMPKKVIRAKVASRYPLVRLAPSRVSNFRSLNVLSYPPVLNVKHRSKLLYNETRNITPSGSVATAYVYTANGLYDPNITGPGHQPMGFDQLMLLYEHYTVTAAKITVSFVNASTTESGWVGIGLFPDSTVTTSTQTLIENGLLKRAPISPGLSNPKSQVSLTYQCNISKLNGRIGSIVGDSLYRGDNAANPTEQTYFHVFAFNTVTVSAMSVDFDVLIEYDAVFTEPRKLAQS